MTKIQQIQSILGVEADGKWGAKSQSALEFAKSEKIMSNQDELHQVKASSFADPADVRAFRACKDRGGTDQDCFKKGDNGVGCWDDDVSEGTPPACALPPEDMEEKWGSVNAAKHKPVEVLANSRTVTCILKDRMPHRANIKNGAGIDLNPAAVKALGLEPPIMISATWRWL